MFSGIDSDASSVASSAPSAASVQPADTEKSAADTNADKSAAPDASEEVKLETCPPETKETTEG